LKKINIENKVIKILSIYIIKMNNFENFSNNDFLNIIDNSSSNNDLLELFESNIPKEFSKEKKMSLLIVVLLQIIFNNNDFKLDKIFKFLNQKNILDLEVTTKKYNKIKNSLSLLIESINNININDINDININNINTDILNSENLNNVESKNYSILNYTNKYRSNFNQINLLGQGSYGSVYKVFHKFEKKFYAIKKIFITKDIIEENYNIFKEIQIYSELINNNIVRYYSSWVDIDFKSILEYNDIVNLNEFEKIDYICPILFIQMELCDFTLKDYLLTFSNDDTFENKINILIQIVNGLEYLKKKNIIHRDLKPDNIFLIQNNNNNESNKYLVKLGDFGLCKKYFDKKINNLDININNINNSNEIKNMLYLLNPNFENDIIKLENNILSYSRMSSYVGTGIYCAPEIKTGFYDSKVDIYSLGIIILELFKNFKTQSEKIITVSKIIKFENNYFPNFINNNIIKKIIFECLNIIPEKRITLQTIKNLLLDNFI